MTSPKTVSIVCQDRIFPCDSEIVFLEKYLASYQTLKRTLFTRLHGYNRPQNLNNFKREFTKRHQITSTYYNSLKNECDGIFNSQLELQKHYRDEYKAKKKSTQEWIDHKVSVIEKSRGNLERVSLKEDHRKRLLNKIKLTKFKIHHKKRRLAKINYHFRRLEDNVKLGKTFVPEIVFGSKALLKKRHYLKENNYTDSSEWKKDWQFHRENSAFFLGDSTEEHRNRQVKGITKILDRDVIDIDISVPYSLREEFGKSKNFTLKGISLSNRSLKHLRDCLNYTYLKEVKSTKDQSITLKTCRFPISYRIKKEKFKKRLSGKDVEEVRYYLQSIIQMPVIPKSSYDTGAIGVDLNVDHLAVGITDRFGNPVKTFSMDFRPYDASTNQNEAALGAMIHDLCDIAEKRQIPLVIEKLKLSILMAKLKSQHYGKTSKKLSSLSYSKFFDMCETICARRKVRLLRVFAGYTSQIGAINYFHLRRKISSHEAAALIIARRGQSKKEYLDISHLKSAPDGQAILSQQQERLAGPALKILKKFSKKIDFRAIKSSYLQHNPGRYQKFELDSIRSHVFNSAFVFRDSA